MTPATLRAICIKNTCNLLLSGKWENRRDNPFSYMPPSVVQDLLSQMLPDDFLTEEEIVHSRLLLSSGRLQHVDLFHVRDFENIFPLLKMLSRGCQNVRSLSLPSFYPGLVIDDLEGESLRELFQNCANLEELHSRILFDPHYLGNCSKLRRLKLHFSLNEAKYFCRYLSRDLLKRLGSIQVFALCQRVYPLYFFEKDTGLLSLATRLLNNCPELTSLGYLESAAALKKLYDRDLNTLQTPRCFQLRRCFWGHGEYTSQFEFCQAIRVAVLSCPQVEVLVIKVHDSGCLKHLETLRNLTSLEINFDSCSGDYGQEFYSLLNEVGPQLQGLSVSGTRHNLSSISNSCPNLTSLQLPWGITAGEPAQPQASFLHLKRLSVFRCNRECLLSLLSNCVHLEVMCLKLCEALEDGVLREILRKNSFAKLEVAHFHQSSLSKSGLTRFVQSARNLKKFSLGSPASLSHSEVFECVKDLNPTVSVFNAVNYNSLESKEFSPPCWL